MVAAVVVVELVEAFVVVEVPVDDFDDTTGEVVVAARRSFIAGFVRT